MSELSKQSRKPITALYDLENLVNDILAKAKAKGASQAEVGASVDRGFSVTARKGEIETLEHNQDKGIGITVYFGKNKGSASTTDIRPDSIEQTIDKACDIARFTQEDEYEGLAEKEFMAFDYPDLELHYPCDYTPDHALGLAIACEQHGMSLDKRITNTEGASFTTHESFSVYGNSHGFLGAYPTSRYGLYCTLLASDKDQMERDYEYTVARDVADLMSTKEVAENAAQRTLRRLGARKLSTRQAPVIFLADVAKHLWGTFISAISGGNLYRESSFLLNQLGQPIFRDYMSIREEPHRIKAVGSAPFDAEGVRTEHRDLVKEGILESYVLGSYSARRLGMQTTGNSGGVHNLIIETNAESLADLVSEMNTGLIVTDMMGHGINIVTGDYSRGATGLWVENGEIQYPVHEITVAGNLRDMFKNVVSVANDVDMRGNVLTGSVFIENMTIAGS